MDDIGRHSQIVPRQSHLEIAARPWGHGAHPIILIIGHEPALFKSMASHKADSYGNANNGDLWFGVPLASLDSERSKYMVCLDF